MPSPSGNGPTFQGNSPNANFGNAMISPLMNMLGVHGQNGAQPNFQDFMQYINNMRSGSNMPQPSTTAAPLPPPGGQGFNPNAQASANVPLANNPSTDGATGGGIFNANQPSPSSMTDNSSWLSKIIGARTGTLSRPVAGMNYTGQTGR
jgi:hypothetical protein